MVNSSTNVSTPIRNNFSMSKVVWATPTSRSETTTLPLADSAISNSKPSKLLNIVSRSPLVMMISVELIQDGVKNRHRMVEPLSCITPQKISRNMWRLCILGKKKSSFA